MFFKKKKGKTPKTSNRKVVPNMKPIEELRTNKDVAEWCRDFLRITDELSPELAIADRAERNYLMALVGLLVEWFPRKDLSLKSLAVLLSGADARENDENFKSALDLIFVQIEEGKAYRYVAEYHQYLWVPSTFRRNSDGVKPADRKGLDGSEDFTLSCLVYKTAEFTPEKESGSIDMDYTFNSNDVIDRLSGETKNLVVFEVMFKGSIENASDETPVSIVASECDKDNEGQTVKLAPSTIGTTATDKSDGDHELMAGKDAVITDEVKYEGLIPGKEYTLHATLMDKKTGEPLKVADKGVTAELKFTPNSESGTVSINLGEFDATSLDGHTLVVFEELTKQSDIDGKATDVTVAEHKDINDEGQSVTVTSTPAGSTYGKTGVDMTNIAIAIGILLIAAGCATAYGIKSRKTTKGDADENAEDNTEA